MTNVWRGCTPLDGTNTPCAATNTGSCKETSRLVWLRSRCSHTWALCIVLQHIWSLTWFVARVTNCWIWCFAYTICHFNICQFMVTNCTGPICHPCQDHYNLFSLPPPSPYPFFLSAFASLTSLPLITRETLCVCVFVCVCVYFLSMDMTTLFQVPKN